MKKIIIGLTLMSSMSLFAEVRYELAELANSELVCHKITEAKSFAEKRVVNESECNENNAPLVDYKQYEIVKSVITGKDICLETTNDSLIKSIKEVSMDNCL